MGDPAQTKTPTPQKTNTPSAAELTAAEAAKAVKRQEPILEGGKPTGKTKPIAVAADELLAWAKRGDTVTVVTTDGQKLVGKL